MAQFTFNNNSSVTGVSPFYANYRRYPNFNRSPIGARPTAEKAEVRVERLQELHSLLKTKLDKISQNTIKTANKKRSEGLDFSEGEIVYINIKNIKTQRLNKKLDHTKIELYQIKKILGPVTYELQIPEGMNIHPVFHKLLLELAPEGARPGPMLIDKEIQEPLYNVERILKHNPKTKLYLVKWLGYGDNENTWEPKTHLNPTLVA